MTSQVCLKNPNSSPSKNWISVGKYLDLRHKNVPYYGDLYAYAANNPVRYTDPDGRWIENEDGSYTAVKKDTLWGLAQLTGRDWHDTDYSGRPEDLKAGQVERFKSHFEKNLGGAKEFADCTVDICIIGSQFLSNLSENGFTKVTSCSLPLRLLPDPVLAQDAKTFKFFGENFGKFALGLGLSFDLYSGIKTGYETDSFWHGFYKAGTGMFTTCAGYLVAGLSSPFITPAGGLGAGIGTSMLLNYGFNKLEEFIWGKQ